MTTITRFAAAAAALGCVAAPAAAQYYPQQYPQPAYPQQAYPQQAYPQQYGQGYPGYGYDQGYAQNPVSAIIDQLLGNRYNVTDRQAVAQCASAAMAQASAQYGGGSGYNNGYGNAYGGGYNRGYSNLRVTSITDVQRRSNGLRVSGTMSSGYGGQYGSQYGYQNRGYGAQQLSFRCNVDYRGAVTNIRIGGANNGYRHY
jgi:hypothetical protein